MVHSYTNGQLVKALTMPVLRVPNNPLAGTIRIWRDIATGDNRVTVTKATYMELERNRYAPWGRGELGGKRIA